MTKNEKTLFRVLTSIFNYCESALTEDRFNNIREKLEFIDIYETQTYGLYLFSLGDPKLLKIVEEFNQKFLDLRQLTSLENPIEKHLKGQGATL